MLKKNYRWFLWLYTAFICLMVPFIVLRLYWKSRRLPDYRRRINERFAFNVQSSSVDIWIHAVSLGEVVAATPLINACLAKQWRVLVTTMTPTGSQQVIRQFADRVVHQYLPYDIPWALKRFFKAYQPRLGIIMETELWPNLIHQASCTKVALLLINARISDGAFQQYEKISFFLTPLLNQLTAILAQSEADAKRFIALGADESLVTIAGNMKFDMPLTAENKTFLFFKDQWGSRRPVVIAASTHDHEEQQLLTQLDRLKKGIPGVVLLVAPRHPERFQDVYRISCEQGWHTGLRSQPESITAETDVVVLDSLGELSDFYQISDYAFVGGSLVPIGGHNVLEPILVNVPVFCGPFVMNFKQICRDLLAADAIILAEDVENLIDLMVVMHQNPNKRQQQIVNATAVLEANRGALERCMAAVTAVLAVPAVPA